jgi:glycosyltransferase involved in cell wall biosynthesis
MILSCFSHVPYFFDEHNVEFIRHAKIYKNRKIQNFILKIFESLACNKAKNIFCVSENDKNLLRTKLKIQENKISVIPNSVDTDKFYATDKNSTEIKEKLKINDVPLIMFFGKLDYKPNHDAVYIIKNEILPRVLQKIPNVRFIIVGDNPPNEFKDENIIFTGLVEKIEDYINVVDLIICPLESGGGTRLKILESLACGKYVVSTTLGAEGINLKEFENTLKIHDDWNSFSNEIIHCLEKKTKENKHNYYSISWKKSIDDMSNVFENFRE